MGNHKDRAKRKDSPGRVNPQHLSDPIVRRDSDVSERRENLQTREVRRVEAVPAPATSSSPFSDAPMGPGRPEQTAPSMGELLFSVLRFKWTLLAVSVLVATPLIAVIWTTVIPLYRARGQVRIQPIIPRLVFRTDDTGPIPFYESFVNTKVAEMRRAVVLNRVLEQDDVQSTKWFTEPKQSLIQRLTGQTDTDLERLRDALSIQPRRGTQIVDVSFTCANAGDAKVITEAVLDQYNKYIEETASGKRDKEDLARVTVHDDLEEEIGRLVMIANGLSRDLGTTMPQERISAMLVRLDATQAGIDEVQQTIVALRPLVAQAGAADSNEAGVAGTQEQPPYAQDQTWQTLNENLRAVRHRIRTSPLQPIHRDMLRMTEDRDFAEESLRIREGQLDENWRRQQLAVAGPLIVDGSGNTGLTAATLPLDEQLKQAERRKEFLEGKYREDKGEYDRLFEVAHKLEATNTVLRDKRALFDQIKQTIEQKEVESSGGLVGAIEVLLDAFVASKPSEDRRVVFTAMALFVGLGMGGGAAFLRASRSQTIYAAKDMPPTLQGPFLGHIPLTRLKKSLGNSLHGEIQRMRDHKIESVRLVRTALLSRLSGQPSASVLIASAAEGTGKSTFTMMLGKSLAHSGKRVLMIDADLRRMTLSKRFGLADESGFMESLRSKSVDQRRIFSTETSGLSILPAGIPNGDGSVFEGTANGAFKSCITQLRRYFDIILLDSSPILPVADATILSSQVDGTIMVERELVSQRPNVVDALSRLDSAGGRLMGTVFVGSRENASYGYGYGYGNGKTQYS